MVGLLYIFWLDSSSREIIYLSDVVLGLGIYIKKLCWVFSPTRVSQDKYCVSYLCLVYLSVDLFNVNCKRTLTCGKTNKKCPFEEKKGFYKKKSVYSKEDSSSLDESDVEERDPRKFSS